MRQCAHGASVASGHDTTRVVLRRPAAGRWTVTPQPDSPAVTDLDVADAHLHVRIRARVAGKGRRRTLSWRRQPAAAEYALMITTADGQTTSHSTTRPRLKLPARPARGRLTVSIVALDAQRRTGPQATARLRVPGRR
jgi:hypothetical protein